MTRRHRLIGWSVKIVLIAAISAGCYFVSERVFSSTRDLLTDARHNKIENSKMGLNKFYGKLEALKAEKIDRVTIYHVGDSHIQADFFTGKVRDEMQSLFGSAGRGLTFPYKLAGTNGPLDYKIESNAAWRSERNTSRAGRIPTGIMGWGIETNSNEAVLQYGFRKDAGPRYGFDTVTVFCDDSPGSFSLVPEGGTEQKTSAGEAATDGPSCPKTFKINQSAGNLRLMTMRTSDSQRFTRIYGISLENRASRGVLYHSAGVNGASFKSFNQSRYFPSQLGFLKPDLVIISLGSNDVSEITFTRKGYSGQMEAFLAMIRENCPEADILFTIPPDFGSPKNKLIREKILTARDVIIAYCRQHNHAYWDFFMIMGGQGSIGRWQSRSLAQKDMIHFTRAGYEQQGDMFFDALIRGFEKYGKH